MKFQPSRKAVISGCIAAAAIGGLLYYAYRHDIGFDEAKDRIQSAPWWIFVAAMIALPPMALPLSIFLVASGARFGLVNGSLIACASIVAHHFIAVGIHGLFSERENRHAKGSHFWQMLERKSGGNTSKLLLLWGLIPGCPYSVKLYLSLSMGARPMQFVRWSSIGHVIGAIAFVAFGKAVFKGPSLAVFIVLGLGIAFSVGIAFYRRRMAD